MDETIEISTNTAIEEEIIKSALELSLNEQNKTNMFKEEKLEENSSVVFLLNMGFTIEEAIIAYSAVGSDVDLQLQYLYSLNLN